jgi:hypothetical protein
MNHAKKLVKPEYPAPHECDICHDPLPNVYYDAATTLGPWACMCPSCFTHLGRGLGVGRGQRYALKGAMKPQWVKTHG